MPELPEVETVARNLRAPLIGRTIIAAHVYWPRTVAQPSVREFTRRLSGLRIRAIERRAKYLVFALSASAPQRLGVYLLVHLKMSGHLDVKSDRAPIEKHDRVILDLSGGRRLHFNDTRKFGRMHLVPHPEVVTGRLGPEPLSDEFTPGVFKRQLGKRKGRLKSLLLDQTFVAGIGNIYADEALWLARLHPLRRADSLSDAEIRALYRAIRAVLRDGIRRNGASFDWVYPSGDYEFRVYDRADRPCRRCRHPIRRMVVGQRGTYFCAMCQTLGG